MAKLIHFLAFLCLSFVVPSASEVYIVHVGSPPLSVSTTTEFDNLEIWYRSFLPALAKLSESGVDSPSSSSTSSGLIYSYRHVFSGFAARLTAAEVEEMGRLPGFVSAEVEKGYDLQTTHSPNFLGLNQNSGVWLDSNYGSGVIIGVLDTGVTPGHPSFADGGVPPPPARWRGRCDLPGSTGCNNKVIGARFFSIGDGTAVDRDGHGTHTSSTAAGNFVGGANVFGNANGTAAGIVPRAHIASYKVCSSISCSESDILAAIDAAIDDGVDIISMSLGGGPQPFFYNDNIAIAAFRAVEHGILVSAAGGNTGPLPGTVQNGAPWMLTVGASTIDRRIRATAVLGNSEELNGESTYQPADYPSPELPLVFPGHSGDIRARYCLPGIGNATIQGRIVVCAVGLIDRVLKGRNVRDAGGAGMIIINGVAQGYTTASESHVLPACHLSYADGQRIIAYLNSTQSPIARISFRGTLIGDHTAPAVASYSSRGPNRPSPAVLKPDIIGPGHNILAAWRESVDSTSNFNIISGTSMSCPHLSGAAALIKTENPNWSPAAIKSALMTTADQHNLAGDPIQDQTLTTANLFAIGSGHVNIARSTNPGLIYDITTTDYLRYLCGLNYTSQQVGIIANRAVNCSSISGIPETELNYPSFSVFATIEPQTYNRTVTNVGEANEVYTALLTEFTAAEIRVQPSVLEFSEVNQRLTYRVTVTRRGDTGSGTILQGSLTWSSSSHSVRSPVVIFVL